MSCAAPRSWRPPPPRPSPTTARPTSSWWPAAPTGGPPRPSPRPRTRGKLGTARRRPHRDHYGQGGGQLLPGGGPQQARDTRSYQQPNWGHNESENKYIYLLFYKIDFKTIIDRQGTDLWGGGESESIPRFGKSKMFILLKYIHIFYWMLNIYQIEIQEFNPKILLSNRKVKFCFRRLKSRWNVVLKRFMVKDQEIVDTFSGQESWNSHAMHSTPHLHWIHWNALIYIIYDQLFFNCSSKNEIVDKKTLNFFHEKVWNLFQITDQQNSTKI